MPEYNLDSEFSAEDIAHMALLQSTTNRLYVLDGFDPAYKRFIDSWDKMCEQIGTPRRNLILTQKLMDPNRVKLSDAESAACEELTKRGFLIRFIDEFIPCAGKQCGNAVLTKMSYKRHCRGLRLQQQTIPAEYATYNPICSVCAYKASLDAQAEEE